MMRTVCLAMLLGLVCAAPADAALSGSLYTGSIDLGLGETDVAISYGSDTAFTVQLDELSFDGTYTEFDLFVFTLWSGELDLGAELTAEVSGIGIFGIANIVFYDDGEGEKGTAVLFRTQTPLRGP